MNTYTLTSKQANLPLGMVDMTYLPRSRRPVVRGEEECLVDLLKELPPLMAPGGGLGQGAELFGTLLLLGKAARPPSK